MNNCPNCGLIRGQHSSVLQGCMCQWQMQAQPKREWVGLTDEEHTKIAVDAGCMSADWVFYGAAVERALKKKNT